MTKNNIFREIQHNPEYSTKNSWSWFMQNVRNLASSKGVTPLRLMGDAQSQVVAQITPGSIYMYTYDPATKDKLPYYDTFPLVIPFSMDKTHFTGLNLHYLHPRIRLVLINKLMAFASDDNMSEKTKLLLSWRLLKNVSKFPEVQPAVKQYLRSHVKSKFLWIHPQQWIISVFLPVEKFKKAKNTDVWAESSISALEKNK